MYIIMYIILNSNYQSYFLQKFIKIHNIYIIAENINFQLLNYLLMQKYKNKSHHKKYLCKLLQKIKKLFNYIIFVNSIRY